MHRNVRVSRERAPEITAVQHEPQRQDSPIASEPHGGLYCGLQTKRKQSSNLVNGHRNLNTSSLGQPHEGPDTAEGWSSGTESSQTQRGRDIVRPAELSGIKGITSQDCVRLAESPDTASPGVLGRTSGAGFMEEAYQALNHRRHKDLRFSHITDQSHGDRFLVSIAADLSMPPRAIVDHLLHTWWEHIHPINPVLHQPTFMNQ